MTSCFKLTMASALIAATFCAPAYADSDMKPWSETFGSNQNESVASVIALDNGGFAVAATTETGNGGTDAWIFTLDANGGMIWDETIGGKKDDSPSSLIQMPDGGFAMAGTTESKGNGGTDGWVVRLNKEGELLWETTLGKEHTDEAIDLVAAPDGGLTVVGMTDALEPGNNAPWIARLDAKGTLMAIIALKRKEDVRVTGLARSSDGLILSGWAKATKDHNDAAWAFKIDQNGKVIWESTLAQAGTHERLYSVAIGTDGNPILAGKAQVDDDTVGSLLMKLDNATGTPIWSERLFTKGKQLEISDVKIDTNGNILAVGRVGDLEKRDNDIWIAGFDKNGKFAWQVSHGEEGHDEGTSIALSQKNQVIAGGWTGSLGQGGNDAWVATLQPKEK